MTAEQILEKHLLLMLKRTDERYVSIDEMKQQPEWQAVINAMLEYGEMQALRMHDIGNPRELLVAFQRDYNKRNFEDSQIIDQDIELFLAANCG